MLNASSVIRIDNGLLKGELPCRGQRVTWRAWSRLLVAGRIRDKRVMSAGSIVHRPVWVICNVTGGETTIFPPQGRVTVRLCDAQRKINRLTAARLEKDVLFYGAAAKLADFYSKKTKIMVTGPQKSKHLIASNIFKWTIVSHSLNQIILYLEMCIMILWYQ